MSWLTTLFKDVEGFFTSPAAKKAEQEIAILLPIGLNIVQEVNTLAPNKTLEQLNTIATKYALPSITALESGVTAGNVALNLATQILQKNLPVNVSTVALSTLNTVIQLAVTAAKK